MMKVNYKDQSWFSTVILYFMLKTVIYDGPLEKVIKFINPFKDLKCSPSQVSMILSGLLSSCVHLLSLEQ